MQELFIRCCFALAALSLAPSVAGMEDTQHLVEEVLDSQEAPTPTIPMGQENPATPTGGGAESGDGVPSTCKGGGADSGDRVPSISKAVPATGWLNPVASKTSLRQWLPEEWRNRFVDGGIADVLVPAGTIEHRISTISAQIVAHAALTVMMETVHLEASSSMWVSIEKAIEVDLLSQKDMHSLKALNREANACKHLPITGSGQVGSSSSHTKRSGPY